MSSVADLGDAQRPPEAALRASVDALPQSVANITDDEVRRIYYDQ